MKNKMKMMHVVWYSHLTASQKTLLTYLISKSDEEGKSWPGTAQLCQVMGIRFQKNFKGVAHYLPNLVTVGKVGRKNVYVLNVPAIEGLCAMEIVTRETPHVPASEGTYVPAPEGTTDENVPSTEGYMSLPQKGLIEQVKNTTTKNKGKTAVADAPALPFDTEQEDEMKPQELLGDFQPPLSPEEREWVRRWRKDRMPDAQIIRLVEMQREEGEW